MKQLKIAVIGLGYVGLPLARLLSTKYQTIGYDINSNRVSQLNSGHDITKELDDNLLQEAMSLGFRCTDNLDDISNCNVYIVAVPTPVSEQNKPNLAPIINSSKNIASVISKGDVVIYESTVYPGATEEVCVPTIEAHSGLKYNEDFFVGYSPERVNPGDKERTIEKIIKVTSGSTPKIADFVDQIYNSVLQNGTHKASSIKVAEASKIIENTQRDVNIAFMNELAEILNALDIDTSEVLEAAATKWNFINLKPGLVGGHCISVDPYYLIEKAQNHGINPRLISNARKINNSMGNYVANRTIYLMNQKGIVIKNSNILIMGITFKENCPDVRNTKVIDIFHKLMEYTPNITVYDPLADRERVNKEYGINVTREISKTGQFDAIILAVAHQEFLEIDLRSLTKPQGIIYDVKGCISKELADARL